MIQYHIEPFEPHTHRFQVRISCDAQAQQIISLPNWIPGSYLIRDFCQHILTLYVTDAQEQNISFKQISKNKYQLNNTSAQQVHIHYQVYAWDLSVRSAHLDQTHGFFNGSSVFFLIEGQENTTCQVHISLPDKPPYSTWKVATGMPQIAGDMFQAGTFEAEDYDALIDYPVEMGPLDIHEFTACGIPHYLVLSGRHFADMQKICTDLTQICETEIQLFGGKAPFDRYLFLTTVLNQGYGGLEHRNSTALICSRHDLPCKQDVEKSNDYVTFLGLCSHEYFHNWNVKRIKPAEFIPYQLDTETYTKQLWAYEGITSYYDDWLLYRSRLISKERYLELLGQHITRVMRGSGRLIQTLNQSSFNAWTKFYQQGANATNAIVSYYAKGALFALYLDLSMRLRTEHRINIDDLMQTLWADFCQAKANYQGTENDTHQNIAEKLCQQSLQDVFTYLDNTQDLPLTEVFMHFGIELKQRAKTSFKDRGGQESTLHWIDLGIQGQANTEGFKIQSVQHESIAAQAGLSAGDRLIAFNQFKVNESFDRLLQQYQAGDTATLHWFRRDELMESTIQLQLPMQSTYTLHIIDENKASMWLNVE